MRKVENTLSLVLLGANENLLDYLFVRDLI